MVFTVFMTVQTMHEGNWGQTKVSRRADLIRPDNFDLAAKLLKTNG